MIPIEIWSDLPLELQINAQMFQKNFNWYFSVRFYNIYSGVFRFSSVYKQMAVCNIISRKNVKNAAVFFFVIQICWCGYILKLFLLNNFLRDQTVS